MKENDKVSVAFGRKKTVKSHWFRMNGCQLSIKSINPTVSLRNEAFLQSTNEYQISLTRQTAELFIRLN